jgi:hypothetical protein
MKITTCSSEINSMFEAEHELIKKIDEKEVVGFKLVRNNQDNFYSVISGLFRYKVGRISRMSSYHSLYEGRDSFRDFMVGKTSIFKTIEDLKKWFPCLVMTNQVVVVKIVLSGDLQLVKSTRGDVEVETYIGNTIKEIEKINFEN